MSIDTQPTNPLGEVTIATLAFPRGAAHLAIHDGDRDHLLKARFSGPQPKVTASDVAVFVRGPSVPDRTTGELGFNPDMERTIVAGRGAAHWERGLTGLDVVSIRIAGAASNLRLNLPPPARRVGIEITGPPTGSSSSGLPEWGAPAASVVAHQVWPSTISGWGPSQAGFVSNPISATRSSPPTRSRFCLAPAGWPWSHTTCRVAAPEGRWLE